MVFLLLNLIMFELNSSFTLACCIALTSLDTISTTLEAEFNELYLLPEVQVKSRAPWINLVGSSTCAWFLSLGTPGWSRIYLNTFEKHAIFWHDVKKPPSAQNEIQISYFSTEGPLLLSSSLIFYLYNTPLSYLFYLKDTCLLITFEYTVFIFTSPWNIFNCFVQTSFVFKSSL